MSARTARASHALAAAVATLAAALALVPGCTDDNAIIGGACASGFTQSGGACVPAGDDAIAPDAADAADAASDGDGAPDAIDERIGADRWFDAPQDGGGEGSTGDGDDGGGDASDAGDAADAADACMPPYDTAQHCGDCFTACSGVNDTCKLGDGGYACAPLCDPPLSECNGQCFDLRTDPLNCGMCGHMCPSLLCQNSMCVGSTAGSIVFAGHDYRSTQPGTAQAHVLANAVFLPQVSPLNVMSYEHYALSGAVMHVDSILTTVAMQLGRTLVITHTSNDQDIPSKLAVQSYQVLLVHDQPMAGAGAMATLGAGWASTLTTFVQAGGVVVVLDGGSGVGEMPQFATATTLLDVSAQSSVATGTTLDNAAPADAIGIGVLSQYGAGNSSVSVTTEPNGGNVVYVIDVDADGGDGPPVVVHKVF